LPFPGAKFALEIVLLNVFAVFWTAENMEEKKFAVGLLGFSGVGVRGAEVMLDSLLGPMLAEPALLLPRGELMFPISACGFLRGLCGAVGSGVVCAEIAGRL